MDMTVSNVPTWSTFWFFFTVALIALLAGVLLARYLWRRNRALATLASAPLALTGLWAAWAAYRVLFGPSWHGHLLP